MLFYLGVRTDICLSCVCTQATSSRAAGEAAAALRETALTCPEEGVTHHLNLSECVDVCVCVWTSWQLTKLSFLMHQHTPSFSAPTPTPNCPHGGNQPRVLFAPPFPSPPPGVCVWAPTFILSLSLSLSPFPHPCSSTPLFF